MKLNTDDIIQLAKTGEVKGIKLDYIAKVVMRECVYMLEFEANYHQKELDKNAR